MKDIFKKKEDHDHKHQVEMRRSDFEGMMKARAKELPRMEEAIQEVLDDYSGTSMCLIVIKEDENGQPEGAHLLMTGLGVMESQICLARELEKASRHALKVIVEAADGDVKALSKIAKMLKQQLNDMED